MVSNTLQRVGALAVVVLVAAGACFEADSATDTPPGPSDDGTGAGSCDGTSGLVDAAAEPFDMDASPRYDLVADIDPGNRTVEGHLTSVIPDPGAGTLRLRVLAGLPDLDANLSITEATVDGATVEAELDGTVLTLPAGDGAAEISLRFSYDIPERAVTEIGLDSLLGGELTPGEIGLLSAGDESAMLGHWFPIWIPPGFNADPQASGQGDIGNFPAATICAEITVPPEYHVISGGTRLTGGESPIVEGAAGIRDLGLIVVRDLVSASVEVGAVTVRVHAPSAQEDQLDAVLVEAAASLDVLSESFGPYPWTELDVVSTPLGATVGGMEWPGMVWIEAGIFGGGLPGLGDIGDLGDLEGLLDEIMGGQGATGDPEPIPTPDQGGPGAPIPPDPSGGSGATTLPPEPAPVPPMGFVQPEGSEGLLDGLPGLAALGSIREWTVAHEIGHQWWHALVGNDSIDAPAFDEPLAQWSACVVMQVTHPDDGREICDAQIEGGYQAMRMTGGIDTPADQPTTAFESASQYGGVVYGKAPAFYEELEMLLGVAPARARLAEFVAQHRFDQVTTTELRDHLASGPEAGAIEELWRHWFDESHGDDDIDAIGLDGLDLDGLDLDGLEGLLDGLLGG